MTISPEMFNSVKDNLRKNQSPKMTISPEMTISTEMTISLEIINSIKDNLRK